MQPTTQDATTVRVNGIEDAPDGEVRIIFKENLLFKARCPNERYLSGLLRGSGYGVVTGDPVGATAFRTLLVSKPGGRPLKADILALLKADNDSIELNPEICA
jgi:hypothetical protein